MTTRLQLSASERTYEARLIRNRTTLCRAVGFFQGPNVAVFHIKTPQRFRRKGHATDLLGRLHRKFRKPLYPYTVAATDEATEFWIQWVQRQERCGEMKARRILFYEPRLKPI